MDEASKILLRKMESLIDMSKHFDCPTSPKANCKILELHFLKLDNLNSNKSRPEDTFPAQRLQESTQRRRCNESKENGESENCNPQLASSTTVRSLAEPAKSIGRLTRSGAGFSKTTF